MKNIRVKKLDRNIFHSYNTDYGFEPNGPLKITVKLNLDNITTTDKGFYLIKIYRKESNSIEELQINNIECMWLLDNISELFKTDLTQFEKILLESIEYYD